MASSPSPGSPGFTNPQVDQLLAMASQTMAIYGGRGSSTNTFEMIMRRHDRFGNAPIPMNSEMVGMTFITKPRFNLTTASLRQDPKLAMMDTNDPMSMMFALRCNLDTVLPKTPAFNQAFNNSPWLNPQSGFHIPLANLLTDVTGFPDFNVEYETSQAGAFAEDQSIVTGSDRGRRSYNLSLTFRDIQGGYVCAYIFYWLHLMALQREGVVAAYADDREAIRLNYTCSIYRFLMDPYQRSIVKWAKATGCFPVSLPMGEMFNFSSEDSYVTSAQKFTVPFVANHVAYMDPRDLQAFNTLVERYAGAGFAKSRQIVPAKGEFNFMGEPYIDLATGTNQLRYLATKEELARASLEPLTKVSQQLQDSVAKALADRLTTDMNAAATT